MAIFLVVKELTVQGTKMINKDLKISESDNAQGLPTLLRIYQRIYQTQW